MPSPADLPNPNPGNPYEDIFPFNRVPGDDHLIDCPIVCVFRHGKITSTDFTVLPPANEPPLSLSGIIFNDTATDGTIVIRVLAASIDGKPIADGYQCKFKIDWTPPPTA